MDLGGTTLIASAYFEVEIQCGNDSGITKAFFRSFCVSFLNTTQKQQWYYQGFLSFFLCFFLKYNAETTVVLPRLSVVLSVFLSVKVLHRSHSSVIVSSA